MTLHVVVCIVGYRNAADVVRCLAALAQSTWPDFSVVISENGGPDAREALVQALPTQLAGGQSVHVLETSENVGFAGGVNLCLVDAAEAGAWWILNPDTEPDPAALELMVRRLRAGDCQAVGCTLRRPDGKVQSHGGRWRPWLARAESIGIGHPASETPDPARVEARQTYLNGASMLIDRPFLEAVGPMREDYFLYCEEVEWCLRARDLGMRLGFAPGAFVLHHQGSTTGAGVQMRQRPRLPIYLDERNRMLLTRDRFAGLLPVAAAAALARITLGNLRRGAWRQFGYGLAGWWAGLAGRRGRPRWEAGSV